MMRKSCGLKMLCLLCASFLAALSTFGRAQKPASKSYVLKAARMFDGKSDALIKPGLVAVNDGKIAGVGAGATIPADAGVYPHGRNTEEFHLMVDLGMKPIDALKAGTSADADLLGLADKIGTLQAGKLADVVAVPGDPVENIRQTEHVFFVMKEGVIYKNDRGTPAH
jgi:imidazolonepropionase-like amidohydrolase